MQNEQLVIKSFKIWPEEERRKEYDRDKPHCAFQVADPAVPETGAMQFSLFLFLPFTAFEQSIGIISSSVLCCWKAAKQITFLKRHQLCPWISGKIFFRFYVQDRSNAKVFLGIAMAEAWLYNLQ